MTGQPQRAKRKWTLREKLLSPKSFIADAALLLTGAGAAQAVMVVTAPLLSRLFTPAEFAGLALLTSTVAIASRISALKYETAMAAARNRPEMGALAAISTWALLAFTIVAIIGPLVMFPKLEAQLGLSSAISFAICLPIVVFFDGMIRTVIVWAVRWRQFKTVSANDITRNGTSAAVQAAAGFAGAGGWGLMLGQTIGTIIAFATLTGRGTVGQLLSLSRRSSRRRCVAVARRYRDFPFFQMPKALLNSLARSLPSVLIASFYSATATGLFFFALRLTALPGQLISQTMGRALIQRFATLHHEKHASLLPLLLRSTLAFTAFAVPVVLVMVFYGSDIFRFFLGPDWEQAGRFAAWTSLWSAATICSTPAQQSLTVQRKNKALLAVEATFVIPRLIPFPIFAASGDVEMAVAISCIMAAMNNAGMILMGFYHAIRGDRAVKRRDAVASGPQ